jgi:hypothetical protein
MEVVINIVDYKIVQMSLSYTEYPEGASFFTMKSDVVSL